MMNYIIKVIILWILLLTYSYSQSIHIPNIDVQSGQAVAIPVILDNIVDFEDLTIRLSYDSDFIIPHEVEMSNSLPNSYSLNSNIRPLEERILFTIASSTTSLDIEMQTVVLIYFSIVGHSGTSTTISFEYVNINGQNLLASA
ncbi:uncharacterized protein METZ01_LOCUS343902, partial [marine metagenome]